MNHRTSLLLATALSLAAVAFRVHAAEPAATPTAPASRFALPPTDDGLPGAGPIRRYDWFQKLWTERRTAWSRVDAR